MKRSILILLLFLVGDALAYTQSITVTSPHSGDSWERRRTHNITWTKTGRMDANVKIRLFSSDRTTKIKNISNSTPNNGSFDCPVDIFNDVPEGTYVIRVKTLNNAFSDDSEQFRIYEPAFIADRTETIASSISIYAPLRGITWFKNRNYLIRWSSTPRMFARAEIGLYGTDGRTKIADITVNTANDGEFDWDIPGSITPGNYKIKIGIINSTSMNSSLFEIKENPRMTVLVPQHNFRRASKIKVIRPEKGRTWHEGRTYEIIWEKLASEAKGFNIELFIQGEKFLFKKIGTINTTKNTPLGLISPRGLKYTWTIPAGTSRDNEIFIIKVSSTDGKASGFSNTFKINR